MVIRRGRWYTPGLSVPDPVHHIRPDYKEHVGSWIAALGPWGWFCHLTFRDEKILEKTAHHRFMRWIRAANEELYGRRYREQGLGVTFARATEHHQSGRIHYHVLISQEVRRLRRLTYKDYWEYGFPRYRKIEVSVNAVAALGMWLHGDPAWFSTDQVGISADGGNGFARIYDYDRRKAGLAENYLVKYITKERDLFLYRPKGRPDRYQSSK